MQNGRPTACQTIQTKGHTEKDFAEGSRTYFDNAWNVGKIIKIIIILIIIIIIEQI